MNESLRLTKTAICLAQQPFRRRRRTMSGAQSDQSSCRAAANTRLKAVGATMPCYAGISRFKTPNSERICKCELEKVLNQRRTESAENRENIGSEAAFRQPPAQKPHTDFHRSRPEGTASVRTGLFDGIEHVPKRSLGTC